ncbi:MAG: tungstate ABC transporter ATP-binding protein WtpC [Methanocellales archaeon]|nr:tungstate ABC transporter ATP-binding protein WtpC [Methanocellales archaeon]
MIEIKGLSKNWRGFSLKNVNLRVEKGEYFIILGPTAAGKTLLLELIAGFCEPNEGGIWINDKNVTRMTPEKRGTGFVYQDYSLFPHLTVKENIEFGLKIKGMPKSRIEEKSKEIMDILGISHLSHRRPRTLSGGEQQRVAIARGIVIEPSVMLLDEPLNALDARTQIQLRGELKKIHREAKLTTIHVTHDQTEAMVLADRIGVMMNGEIVQTGSPEEIFHFPLNERVAEFVGVENIIEGMVTSNEEGVATIRIDDHIMEAISSAKVGDRVRVCLRPESITIAPSKTLSSARNSFSGMITQLVPLGATCRIEIDCGFPLISLVTKTSAEDLGLRVGKGVCASFKASSVHVF